jgi:hypothetical protein
MVAESQVKDEASSLADEPLAKDNLTPGRGQNRAVHSP